MSDINSILPSIAVVPFPVRQIRFMRAVALVQCPICAAKDDFYSRSTERKFESQYCRGSLEPEFECKASLLGSSHTHQNPCAGINEGHFHVQCQCCGYSFFLGLPSEVTVWVE